MRRSNMAGHAEYLSESMGFDSPSMFSRMRCPKQADMECHLEAIGLAILSALLPGAVTVGTAAAATGALSIVTAATAATVGGLAVIGGATAIGIAANQAGKASGKAEAYNDMAGGVPTGNSVTDTTVGGISETELRRRAQLAAAQNNMNNVLSGASTASSDTAPTIKTTLGATSLDSKAVIGSSNLDTGTATI